MRVVTASLFAGGAFIIYGGVTAQHGDKANGAWLIVLGLAIIACAIGYALPAKAPQS